MGLGPREVDALALAELRALTRAWNDIHATEDEAPPPPTDDEFIDLVELVNGGR